MKTIFSPSTIILDTKPLVLFLVGRLERPYVEKFIGTKEFSAIDFDILDRFINQLTVLTTPYILSEVSHLTIENKMKYYLKEKISEFILDLNQQKALSEKSPKISKIFSNQVITAVGANDASLLEINGAEEVPIITSDGQFANYAASQGRNVLKFLPVYGFVNY